MSTEQISDRYDRRLWVEVVGGWRAVHADGELWFIHDEAHPDDPDDQKWDSGWAEQNKMYPFGDAISSGLLKAVRAARGHTQTDAAALLDTTLTTVMRWETDRKTPRGDLRAKLESYIMTGVADIPDRLTSPIEATALVKAAAAVANVDEGALLDEVVRESPIIQAALDQEPERFNLHYKRVKQLMYRRSVQAVKDIEV